MVGLVRKSIVTVLLFAAALGIEPGQAVAEDFLDRLMKSCSEGDKTACAEFDALAEKFAPQLDRLNEQADQFQADAIELGLQTGMRPNLYMAYPIILRRYMNSDTVEPPHRKRGLDDRVVAICAKRFSDLFFINGKELPLLESSEPDWGTIYLMAIDHYFRFCSKGGNIKGDASLFRGKGLGLLDAKISSNSLCRCAASCNTAGKSARKSIFLRG